MSRFDSAADDVVAQINRVHGAQWTHRLDLAKLVVSLCSAILVGTITFSESIAGPLGSRGPVWLLIASWGALLLALLAGLGSLWVHADVLTLHPRLKYSRDRLRKKLESLNSGSPTLMEDALAIVDGFSGAALGLSSDADKESKRLLSGAFILFAAGLTGFLVFGSIRLLQAA